MACPRLLLSLSILVALGCDAANAAPPPVRREAAPQAPALGAEPAKAGAAAPAAPAASGPAAPPANGACPVHLRCEHGALERDPTLQITAIRVEKAAHQLHLLVGDRVVKSYRVALGYGGAGPKLREGDGVTPLGTYEITGRLPTSPWHILLGVSYPNYEDVKRFARLKASGEIPPDANIGFGIALHGRGASMAEGEHKNSDWTLGCIAVDNLEIEEISRLVKSGTTITIVD